MKLRETVNVVRFNASSSSSEGDAGCDADYRPAAPPQADASDGAAPPPPPPGAPARPRLTHDDLSAALLALPETDLPRLAPGEATAEWLRAGGLRGAVVVPGGPGVAAALGMAIPEALLGGAHAFALALPQLLDPETRVPVIDVATQQEVEPLSLAAFARYFTEVRHRRLLNVVSLSLAATPLDGPLRAPACVRGADLVARSWPAERGGEAPAVLLYALLTPEGGYTDWHLDFGGSSVWYTVLAGRKTFALAPPSGTNLRSFFRWASSSRQTRLFLGATLHDCVRVTVAAGDTLLLPGGWPHAVVTPEDSAAVGGNFITSANLGTQCLVDRIEEALGVRPSARFPRFRQLCWYTARALCARLPPAWGEDQRAERDARRHLASRLSVKLAGGGEADQLAAATAAGANLVGAADPADSQLQLLLNAAAANDDAPPAQAGGGRADAAHEGEGAVDGAAASAPEPDGLAGLPTGPPLSAAELVEAGALCAQLRLWLLPPGRFGGDREPPPPDLDHPRRLLSRLRSRLRAAGQAVAPILDTFAVVEETRVELRRREQPPGPPQGPLPAELRDDEEDEEDEEGGKRKRGARGTPLPRRPPPTVRARLAKKLGVKGKAGRRF